MAQPPEGDLLRPATPTATVAHRIREVRLAKGWSAQKLANALQKEGLKWDRSVVANLESGRRANVSVEELMALAYVLDVAPIHLLVPLEEQWYAFTPERGTSSGRIRQWIRGRQPLPSTNPRMYFLQAPKEEWEGPDWKPEDIDQQSHVIMTSRFLSGKWIPEKSNESQR